MAAFVGAFTNKIDAKGRISIPADFRAAIAGVQSYQGVICFPSFTDPAIEGGGLALIEDVQDMIEELDPYAEERGAFAISFMGEARRLPFDVDGRIILPGEFVEHAELDGRATFVGLGDKFQIWRPEAYEAERERARKIARERRGMLAARRKRRLTNGGGT